MAKSFFGVDAWLSVVAIVLVFGFCLIAINSTGLTSITPIGAMGKLTQLTFGVLAPGQQDGEPDDGRHHRRGGQPLGQPAPGHQAGLHARRQAAAAGDRSRAGIIAGAVLSVPVFYLVFLQLTPDRDVCTRRARSSVPRSTPDKYPMPAATIWKAVADVLTKGYHEDSAHARWRP